MAITSKTFKVGLEVDGKTLNAEKGLKRVGDGIAGLEKNLSKMAQVATLALTAFSAPFIALGRTALKAAMDVQESENLYKRSLRGMADETRKWSQEQSRALGLNASDLRKNVALTFRMFENMGLASEQALDMAKSVNILAADMASYFNLSGGAEEAFDKIKSGLVGMSRPLRDLGIIIDETSVKEELHRVGLKKKASELTEVERVYGRYLVIMRRTADVQGDLIRTTGSLTNQLRRFRARRAEVFEELGAGLLGGASGLLTRSNAFLDRLLAGLQNPQSVAAVEANFNKLLRPVHRLLDGLDALVEKMETDPDSFGKALDHITGLIQKLGNAVLWLVGAATGAKLLAFLSDGHVKAAALSKGLVTMTAAMNGSAIAAGSLRTALLGLASAYGPLIILATAVTAVVTAVKELSKLQWSPGVEADPFMAGKIAGIAPKDAGNAKKQLDNVKVEIERLRKEDPKKLQALEAEFWKEQKKGSMVNAGQYMEWFSKRFAAEAAGTAPPPGTENSDALGSSAAERKATFKDFMDAFVKGAGEGLGRELRITSTTGGKHNVGSLHPKGLAFDIVPKSGQMFTDSEVAILREVAKGLKLDLLDERTRPAGQKVWGGAHLHLQASKVLQEELRTGTASAPGSAAMLETFLKSLEEYYNKLDEAERALEEQRYQNRLAAVDGLERLTKEEEHWSMKWGEAWDAMLAATDPLERTEAATRLEQVNAELARVERERFDIEKQLILAEKRRNFEYMEFIRRMDEMSGEGQRSAQFGGFMVGFEDTLNRLLEPLRQPMTLLEKKAQELSMYIDDQIAIAMEWARFLEENGFTIEQINEDMQPFIDAIRTATGQLEVMGEKAGQNAQNIFDAIVGGGSGGIGGIVSNLMPLLNEGLGKMLGMGGSLTAGLAGKLAGGLGLAAGGPWGMAIAGLVEVFSQKMFNKVGNFFGKLFGGGKEEEAPKVRGIPAVWVANLNQLARGFTLPATTVYSGRYGTEPLRVAVGGVNVSVSSLDDVGPAVAREISRELSKIPRRRK